MTDSNCCETQCGTHLFYNLGPFEKSLCVIFEYKGPGLFGLYFVHTAGVNETYLKSEENMIFKIPAGFTATFQITEFSTGLGEKGKYKVSMELHPPTYVTAMGNPAHLGAIGAATIPIGICSGSGACSGTYSPCQLGQVVKKIAGVCQCVFAEQ